MLHFVLAVAAERIKALGGKSSGPGSVEEKLNGEKEAEHLMDETKKSLCAAATKAATELKDKSDTLNGLVNINTKSEGAAREWSTVVDISIPLASFKPIALFLSRSSSF